MGARKHTEEQFRVLFEAAPNGVLAVDAAGHIVLLNAQMEKMFGYSREELIGQPVEVLVPERFRRGHARLRKRFADAPQMRLMGAGRNLIGLCKDGSEFPVEIGLNPIAASLESVVVATVVDITEQKWAAEREKLLEHARVKIEVCQQLGMPAAVLKGDRRMLLLNPLLEKLPSQILFRDDRIELSNPKANKLFMQAVASLGPESNDNIVRSIPVPAVGKHPALIVHLLPMKEAPHDLVPSALGILIVTTLAAGGPPSAKLAQSLFSLTPAEARLAALISSGLRPRQAAVRLGISVQTARTVLKRVFTKVGVSHQSELAVLLAKVVVH